MVALLAAQACARNAELNWLSDAIELHMNVLSTLESLYHR